jgi:hypothetical protein
VLRLLLEPCGEENEVQETDYLDSPNEYKKNWQFTKGNVVKNW